MQSSLAGRASGISTCQHGCTKNALRKEHLTHIPERGTCDQERVCTIDRSRFLNVEIGTRATPARNHHSPVCAVSSRPFCQLKRKKNSITLCTHTIQPYHISEEVYTIFSQSTVTKGDKFSVKSRIQIFVYSQWYVATRLDRCDESPPVRGRKRSEAPGSFSRRKRDPLRKAISPQERKGQLIDAPR